MSNVLHILNGDATLAGFEQTGLDGDVMVWREVLSEGPVAKNVTAADFWEKRSEWICKAFGETAEGYHEKVIVNLEKINGPYEEINLWFEYDLHCQLNLSGIMMMLNQQTDLSERAIFLISPATFPGVESFAGMGELTGEQLEYLYDNERHQLGEYDFTLAREAWALYVGGDAAKLEAWLNDTPFWGNMPNLQPAMQAHLKRLVLNADGLNHIQQLLLDIYNSGVHSKLAIYQAFWQTEKIYGMGDAELDLYLWQLHDKGLIDLN